MGMIPDRSKWRSMVVYLPAFRLERCGFHADEPAGLIDEVKNAMRLIAVTPAARREGLRLGMSASEARALLPGVPLIEHLAEEEEADRASLVEVFERLSDQVTFPWPDALVLQVGSVSHLFGGEEGVARQAVELAESLGHSARAVVADDPLGAKALAIAHRESTPTKVVAAGRGAALLAPLPVESLGMDASLLDALRAVGVATIGEFAALDPASVAGRYPGALELHRVACGEPGSLAYLTAPPEPGPPRVSAPLAGATTTSELRFVLPSLVERLSATLADRDLAAVQVRVVLHLESRGARGRAIPRSESIRVGRPTRSVRTLERLIRARLDRIQVDAPMEEVVLEGCETVPETGWQPGLADRAEATEPLPDLLARLADHLGTPAVFGTSLVDRWAPERAWERTDYPRLRFLAGARPKPRPSVDPVETQERFEWGGALPRPAQLLPKPQPIEVGVDTGHPREPPLHVHFGRRTIGVKRWAGPERLSGEWWSETGGFDRTYWVVLADRRIAWIFEEAGRWFLHGWFD